MRIKTTEGEANVTSQGQGTLNTVLGAVGAAAALGIGTGIIGGNRNRPSQDSEDRPVTRYEMGLIRESLAKDNEITLLKANQYVDRALAGVQQQIAMQNTWNAVQQNNIAQMQGQLGQITKFVVPITSIDPVPAVQSGSEASAQSNG